MSLDALLLAANTRLAAEDFIESPSHSLIITGTKGSGKGRLAQEIAAALLNTKVDALPLHPYFYLIEPAAAKLISIDDIRQVQSMVRLKTLGNGSGTHRVIIIEHAHSLTTEAQNALLKLLEEPPLDTAILMTGVSLQALLPTIISRAQHITIQPPELQAVQHYFGKTLDGDVVERAYRLSEGAVGLMLAIVQQGIAHPLAQALEISKKWVGQSSFERLAQIDELVHHKVDLNDCLFALQRTAQVALEQAAYRGQLQLLNRWQHILQVANDAQVEKSQNAQPKLLLTHMMLEL